MTKMPSRKITQSCFCQLKCPLVDGNNTTLTKVITVLKLWVLELLATLNNKPNNKGKHNTMQQLHGGCLKWILVERTLCRAFLNTKSINHGMNRGCVHNNYIQALRVGTGGNGANMEKYAGSG